MMLLHHPQSYREGTRVIFLKARWKDGVDEQRQISRITHNPAEHIRALDELGALARPGERIYGSACARDIKKAAKHFKLAMVENDYHGGDPDDFYRRLQTRWESSLMQPTSRAEKWWLWDCDEPEHEAVVVTSLLKAAPEAEYYRYDTVNGAHVITPPFDLRTVPQEFHKLRDDNALMLWGFWRKES